MLVSYNTGESRRTLQTSIYKNPQAPAAEQAQLVLGNRGCEDNILSGM